MDLRVLVLIADDDLGGLVRAQVDNLGCACTLERTYDEICTALGWADATVIDLTGDGLDDLYRLRVEAPTMKILAIAPDADREARARAAGVHHVLVEPFSIADIVEGVRGMGRDAEAEIVDLRTGVHTPAPAVEEAPWWATRTR